MDCITNLVNRFEQSFVRTSGLTASWTECGDADNRKLSEILKKGGLVVNQSVVLLMKCVQAKKNTTEEITPKHMGFVVTSNTGKDKMYPGMIITYRVSPLLGIKLNWVTEITHIKDKEYFVDEQRIGPYSMWHHEHKIEPIKGGVLMTDMVTYEPPLGILGALANTLFIKRQLHHIFEYRSMALEEKFGKLIQ